MIVFWEYDFRGTPNPFCSLWWLPGCYFSPWSPAAGFQGSCSGDEEIGMVQVKMARNLLFLSRFCHFSWINTPWITSSLCLISRVPKELILTLFISFLVRNFQSVGALCHHFCWCSPWEYRKSIEPEIRVLFLSFVSFGLGLTSWPRNLSFYFSVLKMGLLISTTQNYCRD